MGTVLDVGIGMVLVFFLASMLASALQEAIAARLNERGKMLELAIVQLLDGALLKPGCWIADIFRTSSYPERKQKYALSDQVMDHGLLDGLSKGDRLSSYIPADKFADALIDVLRRRTGEPTPTCDGLLWAVRKLPPSQPSQALETMIVASASDMVRLRAQIIDWYNAAMDRVTGWYARNARRRTFLLGLALAACFEIDAIGLCWTLAHNDSLRSSLVAAAASQTQTITPASPAGSPQFQETMNKLNALALPIGWSWCKVTAVPEADVQNSTCSESNSLDFTKIALMVLGWVVTALAVAQGAPFWFDLMGQLLQVRAAGVKPQAGTPAQPSASGTPSAAAAPSWAPPAVAGPLIPTGMTADDVRTVQRKLGVPATGTVDAQTRDAIRSFQTLRGRAASGVLDMPTARGILA